MHLLIKVHIFYIKISLYLFFSLNMFLSVSAVCFGFVFPSCASFLWLSSVFPFFPGYLFLVIFSIYICVCVCVILTVTAYLFLRENMLFFSMRSSQLGVFVCLCWITLCTGHCFGWLSAHEIRQPTAPFCLWPNSQSDCVCVCVCICG